MFTKKTITSFYFFLSLCFLSTPQSVFSFSSEKHISYDLTRIVSAIESDGWFMDNKAFNEALDNLMPSVCRVPDSVLAILHKNLTLEKQQIGSPKVIYNKYGEVNDQLETALHIQRKLQILTMAQSQKEDCPFWVPEEPSFTPRQSGQGRLRFAVESGGLLQMHTGGDEFKTGGGGAARMFGFYGINSNFSLLSGFDFGGGAFVNPKVPEKDVDVRFFTALPFVFRFHHQKWHADVEAAFVSTFAVNQSDPVPGWRLGTMIGLSTLRIRNFLPWGGLALSVEKYPSSKEYRGYFVKIGFRAGVLFMD